jgi:hypothetical protein
LNLFERAAFVAWRPNEVHEVARTRDPSGTAEILIVAEWWAVEFAV